MANLKTLNINLSSRASRPRSARLRGRAAAIAAVGASAAIAAGVDLTDIRAAIAELQGMWKFDDAGNIFTPFNAYSLDNIAAFGTPGNSAGSGGGASGVTIDDIKAMGFAEQAWVTAQLGAYATQAWVNSQGFLKQHQSLTAYLTKTDAAATYQPKGDYALTSDLSAYVKKAGDTMTGALTLP
ncbi:MAG: hypothetical protein K2K69_10340, partial [Muribaculaceae bacterium]|nr:hypothetical protein [Muribaculaceae bacterium]